MLLFFQSSGLCVQSPFIIPVPGYPLCLVPKKKTLQSGLYKKSADTVKFPQIWPHSTLQFEFVSESVSFMSLDIKMFVAGELEIV